MEKHKHCQIEVNFYKKLLQVKRNTSTIGIRGELGRHPLLLEGLTNSIKYIESIKSKTGDKLVKEALTEAMKSKNNNSWYNKVICLKKQIMTHPPHNHTKAGIKNYRHRILTHMTNKYEEYWHKELNRDTSKAKNKGGNKLRTS